jgi:glycine cleavage system H lipoate-binding protein
MWYNILINAGITDFTVEEEGEEVAVEAKKADVESQKNAAKVAAKTSGKASGASAKTGVGAKKG